MHYERHLFSQDAGDPVVQDGLLYWPFEDPRFSKPQKKVCPRCWRSW